MSYIGGLVDRVERRLTEASYGDRLYERVVTWDEAAQLVAHIRRIEGERQEFPGIPGWLLPHLDSFGKEITKDKVKARATFAQHGDVCGFDPDDIATTCREAAAQIRRLIT